MKTKILSVAFCAVAALALTSCGSTSSSTTTASETQNAIQSALGVNQTSAAKQAGTTAGSSILSMYNNYKAAGKLDMSNTSNILSAVQLAASALQIKDNYQDKTFYKDFASGMLTSAVNLITPTNVDNTISTLVNTDLSSISSLASSIQGVASAANATTQAVKNADTSTAVSALSLLLNSLNK